MHIKADERRQGSARRRGIAIIYVVVIMLALMGFCSLAVDLGRVETTKSQLRMAADAAARAGAAGLAANNATAVSNAITMANNNTVNGSSLVLQNADVTVGTWSGGAFSAGGSTPNAVKVKAYRTHARGTAVTLLFAQILGVASCDVTASAVAMYVPSSPGYLTGLNSVTYTGAAMSDSYDPALGTYAQTVSNGGSVQTNGNVSLQGSSVIVHGNVYYGPGDSVSGGGTVTGTTGTVSHTLTATAPTAGSAATTNNNSNVSAYMQNGNFVAQGGAHVVMPGGVYYFGDMTLGGGSTLTVSGTTTIYLTGQLTLTGGVVTTSNLPSDLTINVDSNKDVTISGGNTTFDMYLDAPTSNVTISGGANFYGSIIADNLLNSASNIHLDVSQNSVGGISLVQ